MCLCVQLYGSGVRRRNKGIPCPPATLRKDTVGDCCLLRQIQDVQIACYAIIKRYHMLCQTLLRGTLPSPWRGGERAVDRCRFVAVRYGSSQASVLIGMEKSGPLCKLEGKSLTWTDPQVVRTGNNPVRSALQETCGARWKKCRSCTFFLLFLQNPTLEGCGLLLLVFFKFAFLVSVWNP